MDCILHNEGARSYIEISDKAFILESEQDAIDLAALCVETGSSWLLLNSTNISDEFYDLASGLAGAALQKFSNYRINFAAVVPQERIKGRFGEMVLESNRGRQFRFFTGKAEAEKWLMEGSASH
jgi:PadR family transcriptional regulator AphA